MFEFCKKSVAVANFSGAVEAETISKNAVSSKNLRSRGNKYGLFFFLCLFFFCTFSTYAQQSKQRIAVINLAGGANAREITGLLTTQLVNAKKYIVMERSRVQQIIDELGLQSEQNASARAAEIGNLLGVNKIITGEVNWEWSHFYGVTVVLRLVDIESGAIETAVSMHFTADWNKDIIRHKKNGNN